MAVALTCVSSILAPGLDGVIEPTTRLLFQREPYNEDP